MVSYCVVAHFICNCTRKRYLCDSWTEQKKNLHTKEILWFHLAINALNKRTDKSFAAFQILRVFFVFSFFSSASNGNICVIVLFSHRWKQWATAANLMCTIDLDLFHFVIWQSSFVRNGFCCLFFISRSLFVRCVNKSHLNGSHYLLYNIGSELKIHTHTRQREPAKKGSTIHEK